MDSSAVEGQDEKIGSLGLSKLVVNEEQVLCYNRGLSAVSESNPILVLIHGYPQSSYMWRHLILLLPSSAPLFVPDLPGYGGSAPIKENDKLSVGTAIIAALKTVVKRFTSRSSALPVVLIGHDRGARVAHRLAVSGVDGLKILGTCLIDIVPTTTQWAASSNPREICGYFHWPFLANVELANKMITAYGGDRWCQEMISNWSGKNEKGRAKLFSDDSLSVYGRFFTRPHTVNSSNLDYLAGATTDVEAQKEDQEEGRKLTAPVLLIYSDDYIGSRYDVPKEWLNWVQEGVKVSQCALGGGIGHFGAEEAPEESAKAILEWLKGIVVDG